VAYDLWAPSYPATPHNPLMEAEQRAVEACLSHVRAERALDVGTGSGRYLPILASTGATTIIGLDRSRGMLAQIGGAWTRVQADAEQLPFRPASFDVINASLMAGDITRLDVWATGLASLLKPGGHLIYSDFHPCWTERGWERTFALETGRLASVPYVPHAMKDHHAAIARAGLRLFGIHEPPVLGRSPEAATFREKWGAMPVAVVVHAMKELGAP
jgi:malonyl-CoA O-methyltransferase